jgi:putative lipoic acid-binding regulatory protein
VSAIVSATFGTLPAAAVAVRESSAQRYLSVSIVVWVDDRSQLERVYAELKAEPEVLLYI